MTTEEIDEMLPKEKGQNKMIEISPAERRSFVESLRKMQINSIGASNFPGLEIGKSVKTKIVAFKTRLGTGAKGSYNMYYFATHQGDVQVTESLFLTAALQQEITVTRLADRTADDGKVYSQFAVTN